MISAEGAIGVLGSAFNPPHLGHLALAQEALWQLGLEEVILVPTGQAPHKRILDDPGGELRLAMTRLAATEDERFVVSTLEIERDGPSYTYETLEALAEQVRPYAGIPDTIRRQLHEELVERTEAGASPSGVEWIRSNMEQAEMALTYYHPEADWPMRVAMLLSDIQHVCRERGVDFEAELQWARDTYQFKIRVLAREREQARRHER